MSERCQAEDLCHFSKEQQKVFPQEKETSLGLIISNKETWISYARFIPNQTNNDFASKLRITDVGEAMCAAAGGKMCETARERRRRRSVPATDQLHPQFSIS